MTENSSLSQAAESTRSRRTPGEAIGGAAFYAFVGTVWAAYGVHALHGRGWPWSAVGVSLAALLLLALILRMRRAVQTPPASGSLDAADPVRQREEKEGRIFMWVNIGQGMAIFLMVQVCVNLHHSEYITPLFALIVGLHFFVLAPALRTPDLWVNGGLMCLLVVVALLAVPTLLWGAVVGLGSGLIFWGSAAYRLREAGAAPAALL